MNGHGCYSNVSRHVISNSNLFESASRRTLSHISDISCCFRLFVSITLLAFVGWRDLIRLRSLTNDKFCYYYSFGLPHGWLRPFNALELSVDVAVPTSCSFSPSHSLTSSLRLKASSCWPPHPNNRAFIILRQI